MQANVNSAVTSAEPLQISFLIPPAGIWNQWRGHARNEEAGGSLAAIQNSFIYLLKSHQSENKNLFLSFSFHKVFSAQSSNV